jgi:predicted TIM-barrel fold metal-dependent hydrolase
MGCIDSDGHVIESEAEINEYLVPPYKGNSYQTFYQMLPSLDPFHTTGSFQGGDTTIERSEDGFNLQVGPKEWVAFLDRARIDMAVLYPTWGLAHGQMVDPRWAAGYAKTYNDWLHAKYASYSPRLKGVALLPIQDPEAAVAELKRSVRELGMVAGMLPSNPTGVRRHVSHKEFWPIYAAAEELDVPIAFHGGAYQDLGFNTFTCFAATRAIGHPWALAVCATGLIVDGVLDAFPRLRIGLMEGGASWIDLVIDRLAREVKVGGLKLARPLPDYFKQLYLSIESFDPALLRAIEKIGVDCFMFSTDFPHEVGPADIIRELGAMQTRSDLSEKQRKAVLEDNARRLYRL